MIAHKDYGSDSCFSYLIVSLSCDAKEWNLIGMKLILHIISTYIYYNKESVGWISERNVENMYVTSLLVFRPRFCTVRL